MKTSDILANVLSKKGQFGQATWRKALKTRKGINELVEKQTHMNFRAGLDYNSLSAVEMKRDLGELPTEPQPLPWGEWVFGCFPYLITHKEEMYVRLYPNNTSQTLTEYFLNGESCKLDDVKEMILASELPKKKVSEITGDILPVKPDCICVNLKNIIELY